MSIPRNFSPLRIYDFDFTPDQRYLVGAASYAREPFLSSSLGGEGRVGLTGEGGGYKDVRGRLLVFELDTWKEVK